MLQLLLPLLDNEGDDDAWDQGKSNRDDHTKVKSLAVRYSALEDEESREGRCHGLKFEPWAHSFKD